jgi:EmrB/QacA subfamily drug resistance transporter
MTSRGRILALLCAVQFLLVLDVTVVGVALPAIRRELGFSAAGLQWVVSAYVLATGGLLLMAGRLADLLGRRRLFVTGIAVFALGSLACGLAGSGAALIAARAVQGMGAALATPAALALVTTTFPEGPERTRALGIWTAAAPVGGAAGLLLGGALTQGLGWPAVFLVNVPVGAAALALAPRVLPRDEGALRGALAARDAGAPRAGLAARLDVAGAALGTAAVVALAYAFTRAQQAGFGDTAALGALAAAALAAAGFTRRERRAADPLLPPGTLRSRPLAVGVLVSLVLTAATSPTLFFITLHLQSNLGWSPTATGLGCLPVVLAVVAGATAAPRLIARRGADAVMTGGLVLIATGALLLTGITPDGGFAAAILPGQTLYGAGLGAGSVAATGAGTGALAADRQGLASGLLNTAAQVGTALGLAVLVAISATAEDFVGGFRAAFAADAALVAAAALAVGSSRWPRPSARSSPASSPGSARRSSPRCPRSPPAPARSTSGRASPTPTDRGR